MPAQVEDLKDGPNSLKVIHNYGRGSSKMTLHWGCAGDVVALARQLLRHVRPAATTVPPG